MTGSLTAAELQPSLAGRYVIERELGHGGMATVFLAAISAGSSSVTQPVSTAFMWIPSCW